MREKPILTICIPTRNRQRYFQETAAGLTANPRQDVQFVFADNSDDPRIIADFLAPLRGDDRIVHLPPAAKTLSMRDNFERCVEAASGEFVTIIGDDDWIDLDLADLLHEIAWREPEADAVSWSRPVYFWP
jgi:glycosyltransferase involved in cell wall biosynthesis